MWWIRAHISTGKESNEFAAWNVGSATCGCTSLLFKRLSHIFCLSCTHCHQCWTITIHNSRSNDERSLVWGASMRWWSKYVVLSLQNVLFYNIPGGADCFLAFHELVKVVRVIEFKLYHFLDSSRNHEYYSDFYEHFHCCRLFQAYVPPPASACPSVESS